LGYLGQRDERLPGRFPQRVNLFSLSEIEGSELIPTVEYKKTELVTLIQTPGKYRISISITSQDAVNADASFVFEWENFDNISLTQESRVSVC